MYRITIALLFVVALTLPHQSSAFNFEGLLKGLMSAAEKAPKNPEEFKGLTKSKELFEQAGESVKKENRNSFPIAPAVNAVKTINNNRDDDKSNNYTELLAFIGLLLCLAYGVYRFVGYIRGKHRLTLDAGLATLPDSVEYKSDDQAPAPAHAYCPKCNNTYEQGTSLCPDCQLQLVTCG